MVTTPETIECIHDTEGGEECIQVHYLNNIRTPQCKRCKKCGLFIPAHIIQMISEVFHKRPAPLPNLVTVTNRCPHCFIIEPRHATYCKLYNGPMPDAGGHLGATAMKKSPEVIAIDQLLYHLREARAGSEHIMKEAWEELSRSEYPAAEAELDEVIRYLENRKRSFERASTLEAPKLYYWTNPTGAKSYLTLGKDEDGLPVLVVEVEDPHYSGILEHKELFKLITDIAFSVSKKPDAQSG